MSIAPGILNLTFSQGATWKLSMTYTSGDGQPIDLTDYTARMQARISYDSADAVLDLENGTGINLGGTAGTIELLVPADVTEEIAAKQYVYDLEIESPSFEVSRVVQGTLVVTPEVTR
jgi:hypothetical protein